MRNNLRGVLFRNDKQGHENWPDYNGSAEIDRVQYWVKGWIKVSKNGDKYMSLTFEPKRASEVVKGTKNPPRQDDFDDNIPF